MSGQSEFRGRDRCGVGGGGGRYRGASGAAAGGGGGGADIIDLDRYMRRSVRPSHTRTHCIDTRALHAYRSRCYRPAGVRQTAAAAAAGGGAVRGAGGDSSTAHTLTTDTSDIQKQRFANTRRSRRRRSLSNESLMTFRVNCERTLRDQQHQLAHITTLCERLLVAQPRSPLGPPASAAPPRRRPPLPRPVDSSTSRSTQCDKSLIECKTYKIIMSKLDQLNQLFAARNEAAAGVAGAGAGLRAGAGVPVAGRRGAVRRVEYDTSASVSVSNKLVAADLPPPKSTSPAFIASHIRPLLYSEERGVGSHDVRSSRHNSARSVQRSQHITNIQRTVSSEEQKLLTGCPYDLEDPMHLYLQAKRIQELDAKDMAEDTLKEEVNTSPGVGLKSGTGAGPGAGMVPGAGPGGDWLCAWCRTQWRAFRRCLTQLGGGTT